MIASRFDRARQGVTLFEIIIAAIMLVTVMSFVASVCLRINFVWKDINHHRVAVNELTNQLESLTRLSTEEAKTAIDTIKASELCSRTLPNPMLSGEIIEDNIGNRVVLRLNWERPLDNPNPIELTGWIVDRAAENPVAPDGESETSDDETASPDDKTDSPGGESDTSEENQ